MDIFMLEGRVMDEDQLRQTMEKRHGRCSLQFNTDTVVVRTVRRDCWFEYDRVHTKRGEVHVSLLN